MRNITKALTGLANRIGGMALLTADRVDLVVDDETLLTITPAAGTPDTFIPRTPTDSWVNRLKRPVAADDDIVYGVLAYAVQDVVLGAVRNAVRDPLVAARLEAETYHVAQRGHVDINEMGYSFEDIADTGPGHWVYRHTDSCTFTVCGQEPLDAFVARVAGQLNGREPERLTQQPTDQELLNVAAGAATGTVADGVADLMAYDTRRSDEHHDQARIATALASIIGHESWVPTRVSLEDEARQNLGTLLGLTARHVLTVGRVKQTHHTDDEMAVTRARSRQVSYAYAWLKEMVTRDQVTVRDGRFVAVPKN